ncbi:MAG: hypothetical protein OXI38_05075 [Bacteroidota bacterium]|nr:hypothetical protein [Bacteroidota bacterium]
MTGLGRKFRRELHDTRTICVALKLVDSPGGSGVLELLGYGRHNAQPIAAAE